MNCTRFYACVTQALCPDKCVNSLCSPSAVLARPINRYPEQAGAPENIHAMNKDLGICRSSTWIKATQIRAVLIEVPRLSVCLSVSLFYGVEDYGSVSGWGEEPLSGFGFKCPLPDIGTFD